MRVCVLPGDPDGPGHYRALIPAMAMRERGIEAAMPPNVMRETGDYLEINYTDRSLRAVDADVYLVHASMQPGTKAMVEDLRWRGHACVVDVDDYVLGIPSYIPDWQRKQVLSRHLHEAMTVADCVTVSTPFLAEVYASWAPRIEVLPNYLYWPMWDDVTPQYEVERERVRVGWMGSSGWRMGDLRVLQGVIGPWLQRHPEVDFVAAGDEKVHEILGVPEGQRVTYPHVNFRDWANPEKDWTLPKITATMDIGLVPLELSKFNEGKSHLKGMEYGACGIPAIASPTASYKAYLAGEETGFLAAKPAQWTRALDLLVADSALRRRMGAAARQLARENTIDRHVGRWLDLYAELAPADEVARESIRLGAVQKYRELSPLLQMVSERKPQVVVEIGTAAGGNFHALAQSAADDAFLISIDLPGADGYDYGGSVDFERLKQLARPFQRTHFIRSDSHLPECRQFLEGLLEGRTIDLLFIDGDHSYEGVKADFELYSPLVDGIVCLHDIVRHPGGLRNSRGEQTPCDVDRFWREISKSHRTHEFIDRTTGPWGGIGVLHVQRNRAAVFPSERGTGDALSGKAA